MARRKKAVVDYFPHYVHNGKSMYAIESRFGNDGYSFWFRLLELLGSSEHHFIDCNDINTWEFLIAKSLIQEDRVINILDFLARLDCINAELWENKIIRSDNFIDNLGIVYKRREVNVLNNSAVTSLCIQKPDSKPVKENINLQTKVNLVKQEYIKKLCKLFNRRESTEWGEKELKELNKIIKRKEALTELDEIVLFYNSDYKFRRKNIITLLNNWTGELDRANEKGVKADDLKL